MASAEELIKQHMTMVSRRHNWDHLWQTVKDITWTTGGDFTRVVTPGEERASEIFDSTCGLALGKFASVMESLLTPRNTIWHRLASSNPDLAREQEAKEYFDYLTETLFQWRRHPQSQFSDQMHVSYMSLGAYGNQCINPMPEAGGGISYKNIHIGDIWIGTDDRNRIDTTYYKFKMTAHAAMKKWGKLAPDAVQKQAEKDEWQFLEFLHIVRPRDPDKFDPESKGPDRYKLESWEVSLEDKSIISIRNEFDGSTNESGGFNTMPYIYSRFTVDPAEMHGRGPCMLVLPNNQTLQEQARSELLSGQMAVEPPILSMSDAMLRSVDVDGMSLVPGHVIAGGLDERGQPRFKPFINGYRHDLAEPMMDHNRQVINDAHLITLFQILVNNPNMTATEALMRAEEKGQLTTPMIGRQQSETLGRLIARDLDILNEQGLLRDPPPVLLEAEGEYDIVYESAATRFEKEAIIQSMRSGLADIIPMRDIDESGRSKFLLKLDEVGRFFAEARGFPAALLNSPSEIDDLVEKEQALVAQQDELSAVPDMARAAKDLQSANLLPQAVEQRGATL